MLLIPNTQGNDTSAPKAIHRPQGTGLAPNSCCPVSTANTDGSPMAPKAIVLKINPTLSHQGGNPTIVLRCCPLVAMGPLVGDHFGWRSLLSVMRASSR